jgi:putative MFS transporter
MRRHILGGKHSAEEAVLRGGGGRVPSPPHTSHHMQVPFRAALMVAIAAGLGYGFDAYAVNLLGMLGPLIIKDLHITIQVFGLIGSIFLVGYTIGTIGFGWLADRIGRRNTLGYSILMYGFTTAISGLTTNVTLFTILRFLTGIGGAGELAVGAPYTAEMWPKKIRALGTGGVMFSLYSAGYILAALAALYIVPRWGWQATFIFAIVPAILVFFFRRLVQESVRYQMAKDEIDRREREDGLAREHWHLFNIWKIPGATRRIIIGWLLYVPNACGYWGITVFLTTFMVKKFGLTTADAIYWAMIFYIIQFFLSYVGTGLSDFAGRRFAGILGALIMIACTIVASMTDSFTTFAVFGGVMIGMLGWLWGVSDTYMSEFFHTTRRGTAFGIMVGGGRIASIFAPALVGVGIAAWGPTIPFLLTSGLWVITIIGYAMGPETAGRELEEVQI